MPSTRPTSPSATPKINALMVDALTFVVSAGTLAVMRVGSGGGVAVAGSPKSFAA